MKETIRFEIRKSFTLGYELLVAVSKADQSSIIVGSIVPMSYKVTDLKEWEGAVEGTPSHHVSFLITMRYEGGSVVQLEMLGRFIQSYSFMDWQAEVASVRVPLFPDKKFTFTFDACAANYGGRREEAVVAQADNYRFARNEADITS